MLRSMSKHIQHVLQQEQIYQACSAAKQLRVDSWLSGKQRIEHCPKKS